MVKKVTGRVTEESAGFSRAVLDWINQELLITDRKLSPYFSSLAGPTPTKFKKSSLFFGFLSTIWYRTVSTKTTKAGTPWSWASVSRFCLSRYNSSAFSPL